MLPNRTVKLKCAVVLVATVLVSSNVWAQKVSRSQLNSSFDIRYGTVEVVERVKVKSSAPQGAVMGVLIGGATTEEATDIAIKKVRVFCEG
jgi:outer membrane lipoprotein SlyB